MSKEIGKASKAQIEEWKAAHPSVHCTTQTDDEGNVHFTYFRKPSLEDKSYAGTVGKDDGLKVGAALFAQVRLGGSDAVNEDDQLKHGAMQEVLKLGKPIIGETKKL